MSATTFAIWNTAFPRLFSGTDIANGRFTSTPAIRFARPKNYAATRRAETPSRACRKSGLGAGTWFDSVQEGQELADGSEIRIQTIKRLEMVEGIPGPCPNPPHKHCSVANEHSRVRLSNQEVKQTDNCEQSHFLQK